MKYKSVCVCMCAKLLKLCPTLCDPMDCNPPGSSVHGIFQQEYWSGLPCPAPGDLPNPRIEPTSLTSPALASGFFTTSTTWEAQIQKQVQEKNYTPTPQPQSSLISPGTSPTSPQYGSTEQFPSLPHPHEYHELNPNMNSGDLINTRINVTKQ